MNQAVDGSMIPGWNWWNTQETTALLYIPGTRVSDPHPFCAYQDLDPGFEIFADPDSGLDITKVVFFT